MQCISLKPGYMYPGFWLNVIRKISNSSIMDNFTYESKVVSVSVIFVIQIVENIMDSDNVKKIATARWFLSG